MFKCVTLRASLRSWGSKINDLGMNFLGTGCEYRVRGYVG